MEKITVATIKETLEFRILNDICKILGLDGWRIRFVEEREGWRSRVIRNCSLLVASKKGRLYLGLDMENSTYEIYYFEKLTGTLHNHVVCITQKLDDVESLKREPIRLNIRTATNPGCSHKSINAYHIQIPFR